jgi:FixJ family two-component response regulator
MRAPGVVAVHVVDDDASFRTSIGRLLRSSGYEVVAYPSADQLLQQLPDGTRPGCILLDVQLPGLSGPELQARLAASGCALPIVFLTGHGDIPTSVSAIKAGAEDFLTKPVAADRLIDAIERAVARFGSARRQRGAMDSARSLAGTLTPRERQVFERVARGLMNKQIARELGTSEQTIKAHRQKVMEKMGAGSLAELVVLAERLGILAAAPAPDAEAP